VELRRQYAWRMGEDRGSRSLGGDHERAFEGLRTRERVTGQTPIFNPTTSPRDHAVVFHVGVGVGVGIVVVVVVVVIIIIGISPT